VEELTFVPLIPRQRPSGFRIRYSEENSGRANFCQPTAETATSVSNTFALSYASKHVTGMRSELGARFNKAMLVRDGIFTLKARTAWEHDWNIDQSATATFQTLPSATFATNGAQPSANAALLLLGRRNGVEQRLDSRRKLR
jgi:hypothetical protein